MLLNLSIKNFAIIDSLEMQFDSGFNVLTGETGAGKSILMDALNLILGGRAGAELVRSGAERSIIDAVFELGKSGTVNDLVLDMGFELEEGRLILSREVSALGKSTCRVAGRPATVGQLKEIGDWLVDLHGQHEHQSLLAVPKHLDMLDNWGGRTLQSLRIQAGNQFHHLTKLLAQRKGLETDTRERTRKLDLLSFQTTEISRAELALGEDQLLDSDFRRLANSQRLKECAVMAAESLSDTEIGGGVQDSLNRALRLIEEAAILDESLMSIAKTVLAAAYEIEEAVHDLNRYAENLEFDPEKLAVVDRRLELIRSLKRKYGDSIEEIIQFGEEAFREITLLSGAEEQQNRLDAEISNAQKKLNMICAELSVERTKSAIQFQKDTVANLSDLGMEKTRMEVRIEPCEPGNRGADSVEFLIAVNPGEPLRPLAKVASGGEISRIMLAIKSALSLQEALPTMVFDEIDAGVGGRTASAIADKMVNLSQTAQILCITHLPQIASQGDRHFFIEKFVEGERTHVVVRQLDQDERVHELARMLGGSQITEAVVQHAREMLGV